MTKPGIIYGNAMTAAAGFLLASRGHIDFSLLVETLAGICLVIASACVFNNYIDMGIDQVMSRTKNRALVKGFISKTNAIIFGVVLGLVGFLILGLYANRLVTLIGVVAFVDYVIFYGITKRRTVHSTLVGSISGAAPIVAGYCAVTDHFGVGAFILFFILVFWQMPHFYAIAMYRLKDYGAAKLPVLPVKKGIKITKIQSMFYIAAFIVTTSTLRIFGYAGNLYLVIILILGLSWFGLAIKGFKANNDAAWARKMFFFSLIIILSFSLLISMNHWLI